jgi:hypothetical protein
MLGDKKVFSLNYPNFEGKIFVYFFRSSSKFALKVGLDIA